MSRWRLFLCAFSLSGLVWGQPAPLPTPLPESAPAPKVLQVVKEKRFLIALGETLKFPVTSAVIPPANQYCRLEKKAGGWFATGIKPGLASFQWDGVHWQVIVRERALKLPAKVELSVFGDYPPLQALLHWARDFLHPGAELKENGGKLLARGPDLIAYEGLPELDVKQELLEKRAADNLILSNWPEKIEADQILLEAPLSATKAWRVMVHHRNMPEQPLRWLEIEIIQPAEVKQRYAISSYLNGPASDEIFCGHAAALRFFNDGLPRGYCISVAGGQRHLLERAWLKPGQTVSAMLFLRPLLPASQPGLLRISTRTPDNNQPLSLQPLNAEARTARGVFPAQVLRELTYRVGSAYLFEDIGSQPYLTEINNNTSSPGNFGAVYRYRWTLENTTDQPAEVRMELSARGGPARANVWLDGETIETGLLKAEAILLKRWFLAAGEKRIVIMETFPQAGSNFPLSLTLSSKASDSNQVTPPAPTLPDYYIP